MTQETLRYDPFAGMKRNHWPKKDPLKCSICHETFTKEEWARRCEAQGPPPLRYHTGYLVRGKGDRSCIFVVRDVRIHHAFGVKCHIEGPCPHDVTYYFQRMYADWFGPDRAWLCSCGDSEVYHQLIAPREVIGQLTMCWGIIQESGEAETYMAGPRKEEEWAGLWKLWDDMEHPVGRRAGRRLFK